jgi:diadenosine tetraphosphate (Ap4A) HIT family hydrolase
VQSLAIEMRLEAKGYRLIANGGGYQDVPQLHFHLIGGSKDEVEERGI